MPLNLSNRQSTLQPPPKSAGRRLAGTFSSESREKASVLVSLPPFPAIAMRVLDLLSKEELGLKELTQQIQADAVLSSEILTVSNSVLFGFRTEIRSILQATTLLGAQRVKGIAMTIAMKTYLTQSFHIPVVLACWRHNLACGLVAEELAKVSLIEKDFAYLAGLLHDIGRLALGMTKPQEYAELLAGDVHSPAEMLERERQMFGIDHCEAGRRLMLSWRLPQAFCDVAAEHHGPKGTKFDIVALVNRSCLIADAIGFAAASSLKPRRFEDILLSLPDRERKRFAPDLEQFAKHIAIKINALE
ncbi:MAG: HDOD domain-containing protein [Acidobacteriota bacterium]|nr:HDOD domain-containing protein [Acidobacteriota bacterium]